MFSTKQLQILAFAKMDYDMLICDGAIRSGKTSIMTVAFIEWAMQNFNECNFAICGKTVGSAIKNIIKPYMALNYAREKYDINFNRAENLLTVKRQNRRNLFYVYGGKDESSYTLIQGITLAGVLLDEVALMVQSFVEQAMARCSIEGSRFWVNCNPETPSHWFYRKYICESSDEYKEMITSDALKILHLHFLMEDNPSLSERMISRYKAQYSGVFYQKYIEGKWVRAEGIVFAEFAEDPHKFELSKSKLPRRFKWVKCGYDIGGNGSAFSLVCSAQDYNGTVYTLRAVKIQPKNLKFKDVEIACIDFIKGCEKDYSVEVTNCYVDDNYYLIINGLNEWRYIFDTAARVKNTMPLFERPVVLSKLMATGRYYIVEGECEPLKNELCEAVFDPKAEKTVILDDGSMQIDTLDSLWYSLADDWHYLEG